jgi:tetratricopeptide (TPR) repeat protein
MEDDQFDEPLPPLAGVSPGWRLLAVLSLLGAVLLLCVVTVLVIALAHQSAQGFANNNFAMAGPAPPMAAAGPAVAAEQDVPDPDNPPYPTRQDLRPAGTFPLPGDAEEADERPAPSLRRQFLNDVGRNPAVWSSTDPEGPDYVLVSPDGQNMAYAWGHQLLAGPLGAPEAIDENGPVLPGGAGMAGMARRRGGWAAAQGQPIPAAPPKPLADHPHAALSGWSADGTRVYWRDARGFIQTYIPQAGRQESAQFRAEAAVQLPLAPEQRGQQPFLAIRRRQQAKAGGADRDRTELVLINGIDAPAANPRVLSVPADDLQFLALSPDGRRLAVVAGSAARDQKPARWRVVLLNTETGGVLCTSPEAARYAGVCWTTDGKAMIYARSLSPVPADHAPGTPPDACDLFQFDPETKKETRLSRGGGFTSPSVAKDDLFFLNRTTAGVALEQMPLERAREFAEEQEQQQQKKQKDWAELAEEVCKRAGRFPDEDGKPQTAESIQKMADAFAQVYRTKFKEDPPGTVAALDWQRRQVEALDVAPLVQTRVRVILGSVEGEYLRRQHKDSAWHIGPHALTWPDVVGENPFGFAFNPFQLLPGEGTTKADTARSLAEALFRAEGRVLVLSNDPAVAKKALDKLVDPDLARGTDLLKQNKGDEADRVLLEMAKRHDRNYYLMVHVGTLFHEHGRKKALAELLQPLLGQVDRRGAALPRDPRLYNLLGIAALDGDPQKAMLAFGNALRCDQDYGPAYLNLAQASFLAGHARDARLCLRRYLALFPKGEWAEDARRRLAVMGGENGAGPPVAPQ